MTTTTVHQILLDLGTCWERGLVASHATIVAELSK